MIKTAVVAAAGQGTRMMEFAKDKPKQLINVIDRPFLAYLLDNLFYAGYQDIILVVGYKEELMEEFVKEYHAPGKGSFSIRLVSQYEILGPKEKEYGTACPLKCVRGMVDGPFIFIYGDNLYSVRDLKAMNISDGYQYVAAMEHDHPEKYGVLVEEGGLLKEIVEKPKIFMGNLINTGPFTFTPEVFEKISQITKSSRGEYEITDVISLLAKEKKVRVKRIQDYWIDFGNPEDIKKLSEFISNGSYRYFSENIT